MVYLRIEDLEYLSEFGGIINKQHKRVIFPMENGGRAVGYFPVDGVQIYAYDIRGGKVPGLMALGLRQPENGRFLRTNMCRSGKCEFHKNGRSAILNAGEVTADYGESSIPLKLSANRYLGVETILQVDEFNVDNSIYKLLRNSIKSLGIIELQIKKEDMLFYFTMAKTTKHRLDELIALCFNDCDPSIVLIKTAEIGYNLCEDIKNGQSLRRSYVTKSQLIIAEDIHTCLSEHYGEKWVASYFSEKYGFSTTTVKSYFKSVYGYEFKEYQIKVRMEKAAELLCDTDMQVGEISSIVGYSTQAKFGATFKNYHGVTPLEYRRSSKIERANSKSKINI